MQKSRGQKIATMVGVLFLVAITSHRIIKIVQKEERRQLEAESVIARTIWNIALPSDEFIGDLTQVGTYLIYEIPAQESHGAKKTFARRLDNGVVSMIDAQESHPLPDPLLIGHSLLQKKEFRIEHGSDGEVVAQYNVATRERGILAKLPNDCTDFKTVQRLPQNFFALEAKCVHADTGKIFKRLMVLEFETRRLTYASGHLPKEVLFVAFTR